MILSPDQFTAIPQQFFTEDICLVWLDDSKGIRKQRYDEEKRNYNFNEKEEFERLIKLIEKRVDNDCIKGFSKKDEE